MVRKLPVVPGKIQSGTQYQPYQSTASVEWVHTLMNRVVLNSI